MQQQQPHQGGGAAGLPYGAPPPDMEPFSPPAAASGAMPLSSRPPSSSQQQQMRPSYEELTAVPGGAGGFPDDEVLGGDAGGGAGGSGASSGGGNRWPREETLALIRIRSEMDATFRDATLKAPLWEDVSRKLAELGYKRSAKKCKEKFENVHKYYKRTKDGRAGRQDGKSYRFFSELEALHAASQQQLPTAPTSAPTQQLPTAPTSAPTQQLHAIAAAPVVVSAPPPMNSLPPSSSAPMQPAPISAANPAPAPLELPPHQPLNLQGLSFSSMSDDSDSDDSDSDDDMTEDTEADRVGSKRKRGGGGSRKMMSFFEGLMQQVVERQEEMQRRFLETMEKREAERTTREEAWRRQEVARLNREQDQLAQERAAAASRDAAIIAFLQRVGHHPAQVQNSTTSIAVAVPMPAPPQMQLHTAPKQPPPRQQPAPLPPPQPVKPISSASPPHQHKETPSHHHDATTTPRSAPPTSAASSLEIVPVGSEQHYAVDSGLVGGGMDGGAAAASRWPKAEVHALIQLRLEMDMRYNETGPKGPLWEEISSGMRRLGYNRSSKRCKEKWENINKYYKKVKESNKKRPEDSKTCPYFHQLEAIYRKKQLTGGAATNVAATPAPAFPTDVNQSSSRHEIEGKSINDDKRYNGGSSGAGAAQAPTSNGGTSPTAALDGSGTKKPEDIVRELSERRPPRELTTDETDSDGEYTDDGEEAEDDGKMQYRIQFQRPNSAAPTVAPAAPATTTAPAVQASPPTTTNTFAAMVQ